MMNKLGWKASHTFSSLSKFKFLKFVCIVTLTIVSHLTSPVIFKNIIIQ